MSCLDYGIASKAVKHAGLFLLPKITGIRFQAGNVSQPRYSFARLSNGVEMRGDVGLRSFMAKLNLLHEVESKKKKISNQMRALLLTSK